MCLMQLNQINQTSACVPVRSCAPIMVYDKSLVVISRTLLHRRKSTQNELLRVLYTCSAKCNEVQKVALWQSLNKPLLFDKTVA